MLFLWLKGVKYFILFVTILCLCLKSKRTDDVNKIIIDSFVMSSELVVLPEKICFICSATSDVKQRKLNYPEKHPYGLNYFTFSYSFYSRETSQQIQVHVPLLKTGLR